MALTYVISLVSVRVESSGDIDRDRQSRKGVSVIKQLLTAKEHKRISFKRRYWEGVANVRAAGISLTLVCLERCFAYSEPNSYYHHD